MDHILDKINFDTPDLKLAKLTIEVATENIHKSSEVIKIENEKILAKKNKANEIIITLKKFDFDDEQIINILKGEFEK